MKFPLVRMAFLPIWDGWTLISFYLCWCSVINSLAPGKLKWNKRYVIFKLILVIDGWGISSEIVVIWMSLDFIDDQSTLVQVMAWCCQTTSHYLNQCWPRFLSPYGVTRPQWVNQKAHSISITWNNLTKSLINKSVFAQQRVTQTALVLVKLLQ